MASQCRRLSHYKVWGTQPYPCFHKDVASVTQPNDLQITIK
uniref:Uncharacterized protein n=1 Tax=Rhizophora mucronata TaxID=61149 RepID=A0A2P2NMV4_RHIMU